MPDWNSPAEIAKEAGIFVKLLHSLLGLYAWVLRVMLAEPPPTTIIDMSGSSLWTLNGTSLLGRRNSVGQW